MFEKIKEKLKEIKEQRKKDSDTKKRINEKYNQAYNAERELQVERVAKEVAKKEADHKIKTGNVKEVPKAAKTLAKGASGVANFLGSLNVPEPDTSFGLRQPDNGKKKEFDCGIHIPEYKNKKERRW